MTPSLKSKPKVLLVDSNAVNLNSLCCLLKEVNCEIYKASNGMDAFEIALKYKIDLFISELFLPLMDGNTLVKEVRKLHYGKDALFFFVADEISEDTQIKCITDGADDVFIRPFNLNVFKVKIIGIIHRINDVAVRRKSFLKRNLNVDLGEILYCYGPKSEGLSDKLHTPVIEVDNYDDFIDIFENDNIWIIVIDEKATWAITLIHKIKLQIGNEIPIWLVASHTTKEADQVNFLHAGGFGILKKYKNKETFISQINNLIIRDIDIKNQYINSIKEAVKLSPVHFSSYYEEEFKHLFIKIQYEPFTKPAGGDFYEITKFPNGNTLILLGDVMGKRWGAWFFANAYLAYIRASLKVFPSKRQFEISNNLGYLVSEINQFLYKDIQLSDAFTTLTAILITPSENKFKVASAGAIPPIFYSKKEKKCHILPVVGKILGVVEEEEYQSTEYEYEHGDKIILLTDGYTEAVNTTSDRIIGVEKITSTLELPLKRDITDLKKYEQAIITNNSIEAFNDDRTMLLVDFK